MLSCGVVHIIFQTEFLSSRIQLPIDNHLLINFFQMCESLGCFKTKSLVLTVKYLIFIQFDQVYLSINHYPRESSGFRFLVKWQEFLKSSLQHIGTTKSALNFEELHRSLYIYFWISLEVLIGSSLYLNPIFLLFQLIQFYFINHVWWVL